LRGMVAQW